LNTSGARLATVRQLVNMPRPPAEVRVVLERDGTGPPTEARLSWESALPRAVEAVNVSVDGTPLLVVDKTRAPLPAYDLKQAHLLRAEVDFGDGIVATEQLAFGGEYIEQSEANLTAVPILLGEDAKTPTIERLSGILLANGTPAQVVAVEEPPATIAVVVPRRSRHTWFTLLTKLSRTSHWPSDLPPYGKDTLVLQSTEPQPIRGFRGEIIEAFPANMAPSISRRTWLETATRLALPGSASAQESIGDALCVAALTCAGRNNRRVVALLVTPADRDAVDAALISTRSYLSMIGVPLALWTEDRALARNPPPGWKTVEELGWSRSLLEAAGHIDDHIDRQRIVWIGGTYLPQQITLAQPSADFTLLR
jgi:hypothetical protein